MTRSTDRIDLWRVSGEYVVYLLSLQWPLEAYIFGQALDLS